MRANFAEDLTADEDVADPQRAVLHQHRRHRTASAIQLGFEHRSDSRAVGFALQILDFGNQQNHLQQQIDVLLASWPTPEP